MTSTEQILAGVQVALSQALDRLKDAPRTQTVVPNRWRTVCAALENVQAALLDIKGWERHLRMQRTADCLICDGRGWTADPMSGNRVEIPCPTCNHD